MRRLVVVLALALAACGGSSDSSPTTTQNTAGKVGQDKNATDANNYDIAYQVCSAFPPAKLASDLGITSRDPTDIATAYANAYTAQFRQANLEGCLDALTGQPKQWP